MKTLNPFFNMDYKITSDLSRSKRQKEPPENFHHMIELHVPDFQKTKDFYHALGFDVVWERLPEDMKGYCVMKMEENLICFWGGSAVIFDHIYFKNFDKDCPKGFGVEIVFLVSDIESLYKKAKSLNCVFEELNTTPWGLKYFRIVDPWGFYIRFTEHHNILSDENAVQ